MRTSLIKINGKMVTIEEPETNKMCEELTRLITIANYWDNKPMAYLLKICLKARDRRKMIFGHPQDASEAEKKFNTFYSDTYTVHDNGYSVFVSSLAVFINNEEIPAADAYIKLVKTGMCSYRKNNPFGVIREGNCFKGYTYKNHK